MTEPPQGLWCDDLRDGDGRERRDRLGEPQHRRDDLCFESQHGKRLGLSARRTVRERFSVQVGRRIEQPAQRSGRIDRRRGGQYLHGR